MQNKKSFEIILHVGRVTSLRSWVAKKSSHGQTLINECSISDYPSNFLFLTTLDELVEIFLKLSMETVQVHLIIWTTLKTVLINFRNIPILRRIYQVNLNIILTVSTPTV